MGGNTMKHYSKEFKEEALKLSDEIGVKKAAQHTPKYTAREDTERRGTDDPHP